EQLRCLELYGLDKSHCRTQATVLVFHMADMDNCDASACQTIYELVEEYRSHGVGIFITHLRARPLEAFEKAGIVKLLGADAFHDITILQGWYHSITYDFFMISLLSSGRYIDHNMDDLRLELGKVVTGT
ncbi:hypothetical protein BT96DRAFT_813829, partial [Gymnopus androsaceus JB14]